MSMEHAIRHNHEYGNIEISLSAQSMVFRNTGSGQALDPDKIFERFYKDSNSEGTGLGLAILKQICSPQHFGFSYAYTRDLHCFEINF